MSALDCAHDYSPQRRTFDDKHRTTVRTVGLSLDERGWSGTVVLDGGTGTELEKRGVLMDGAAWSGPAAATSAATLTEIHLDFLNAGARIITANTFAASPLMLGHSSDLHLTDEINRAAVVAAQRARDLFGEADVIVAGSISHMLPVTQGTATTVRHTADQLRALEASARSQAGVMADAGVDVLILEMMYDPERARAVLAGASGHVDELWFMISARHGPSGQVLSFEQNDERPLSDILAVVKEHRDDIAVSGVMHTDVGITGPALDLLAEVFRGPLAAYPDSGFFEMPHWNFTDVIAPEMLGSYATEWASQGVRIIGGCCGLGPDHIAAVAAAVGAE